METLNSLVSISQKYRLLKSPVRLSVVAISCTSRWTSEFLRARVRVLTIIDMMLYSCSENGSSESRISCRAPILLPPISMGKKSPFEALHFRGFSQSLSTPVSDLFLFRHFTAVL